MRSGYRIRAPQTRELEEVTGRPVLGVVSLTSIGDYTAVLRRSYLRYATLATGLVAVFALVLALSLVAPDLLSIA